MAVDRFFDGLERYVQNVAELQRSPSRLLQSLQDPSGITTQEAQKPEVGSEAIEKLATNLREHRERITDSLLQAGVPLPSVGILYHGSEKRPIGDSSLDELRLRVGTYNSLKRRGISRVEQVLTMTKDELLGIKQFGTVHFNDLLLCLVEKGFLPPTVIEPQARKD